MYEVVSEYAKSILACMENTLKEDKHIWRMRQEHFAVYGEYAIDIKLSISWRIFTQNKKI
jgi:hypothetical protein